MVISLDFLGLSSGARDFFFFGVHNLCLERMAEPCWDRAFVSQNFGKQLVEI